MWKQPQHQDGEAGAGARPVEQLAGGGLRRRSEELLPRPLLQALPGSRAAPAQLCCQENRAALLKSAARPRRQQGPGFRHRGSRDGAFKAPRDRARAQLRFGKREGHRSVSCHPREPGPRAQLWEAGAAPGTSSSSRTEPREEPWEPWWLPQPRDKACPGWEHPHEQHWHPSQVLQPPHEQLFVPWCDPVPTPKWPSAAPDSKSLLRNICCSSVICLGSRPPGSVAIPTHPWASPGLGWGSWRMMTSLVSSSW